MALNLNKAEKQSSQLTSIEEGSYVAKIFQVIDMGIQPKVNLKTGKQEGWTPAAWLTFEFPTEEYEYENDKGETIKSNKILSKKIPISLNEKSTLTKLLNAVGEVEDLKELINRPVMVSVGKTSGGKAKIVSFMKTMKGFKDEYALVRDPVTFDFEKPDQKIFESLPEFLQKEISKARNFKDLGFTESNNNNDDSPSDESQEEEDLPW